MESFKFVDKNKENSSFILKLLDVGEAFKVSASINYGTNHKSQIEVYEIKEKGVSPTVWICCTPGKAGEILKESAQPY